MANALIQELKGMLAELSRGFSYGGGAVMGPPAAGAVLDPPKSSWKDTSCECPGGLPCTCGYEDEFDGQPKDDDEENPDMFPYGVTSTPYGIGSTPVSSEGVEPMKLKVVESSPSGISVHEFADAEDLAEYFEWSCDRNEGQVQFTFHPDIVPFVVDALGESEVDVEDSLSEGGKRQNPFNGGLEVLGKAGVKGFTPGKQRGEKKFWKCTNTAPYSAHCVPIGNNPDDEKQVDVDKGWKKRYNREYAKLQASGKGRASKRSKRR